ncbi:MAG: hypothetical protein IJT98_10665 [Prevotella sp.]|nr:hypothetical protein [Prevotella sp.]
MRKLFFAIVAVAGMTLASCGTTPAPGAVEAAVEAPAQAGAVADSLQADLNSGNANTFKARITAIIEKVKELVAQNPQVAQEYFTKAQEFLKANASKISALVGDNAEINALVSTIADGDATQFVGNILGSMGGQVQDAVQGAVEGAVQNAVQDAAGQLEGVSGAVQGAVQNAVQDAAGQLEGVSGAVQSAVGNILGGGAAANQQPTTEE